MVSIPLNHPPEAKDRHRAALPAGVVLSVLFHVMVAVLLLLPVWWHREIPEHKTEFVMEMVQLPEPKVQPPPRPLPPAPPAPVFNDAPIAENSTPAPPPPTPAPLPRARPRPEMVPGGGLTQLAPKAATPVPPLTLKPQVEPVPESNFSSSTQRKEPGNDGRQVQATQAFRDFILQQIAQKWVLDIHGPRYSHITLEGPPIVVQPDGFLASPWGKNDPLDLRRMIRDYDQMGNRKDEMTALVTFLQAMRQAQPFRLPADGKDGQARVFQLYFTLDDVPR